MTPNEKPLKLLMLVSSYPRNREDSSSVFLRHLAENLSDRGVEVHVLTPADKEGGTCREGNISVHRFRYLPICLQRLAYGSGILTNLKRHPSLWFAVPFFLFAMTLSLFRFLWSERPDLIHAHWVLPQGLVAIVASFFHRRPVVTTAHGSDAFALRGWLLKPLKRFVLRQSNAWTSNTLATSKAFGPEAHVPPPQIIPMGVNVSEFHTGKGTVHRKALPEDERLILFVGRLVENKGLHELLSAFALLPTDLRSRSTLWVIGDGACRSQLQELAHALGISDKTRFWGQVDNHLLPDYYAAGDILVCPSITASTGESEGQAIVILEAFAAGLCVLATATGGIREVIDDGRDGILVESRNPNQLAAAMATLLRDQGLRNKLGNNGLAKVRERYDWKRIAQDFETLYRAVL